MTRAGLTRGDGEDPQNRNIRGPARTGHGALGETGTEPSTRGLHGCHVRRSAVRPRRPDPDGLDTPSLETETDRGVGVGNIVL